MTDLDATTTRADTSARAPLRVAMAVSRFPVRSETFILRQIVGLLDLGCSVDVLPLKSATDEALPEEFAPYDLLARTRFPPGQGEGRARKLRALIADLLVVGRRHPLRCAGALLGRRRGSAVERLRVLRAAATLVRSGPYDVLHCHYGPIGVLAARARRIVDPGMGLTVVFHGYDLSRAAEVDLRAYAALFAVADLLLPVSQRWQDRLLELGAPPDRVVVHHMGVDLADWAEVERVPGDELRLVSVCRLVEKKGIGDAIRAAALLRDRGVRVRYTVAGDGPLLDELRAEVERLGVGDRVALIGWVEPAHARRELIAADVLLAPSVTASDGDQEGIPVSIMEAMATGMPVVATWHSGIPELVTDGETGELVPEGSPPDLADRIEALARDDARRVAQGRAARERVEHLHDQRQLNRDLRRLLAAVTHTS